MENPLIYKFKEFCYLHTDLEQKDIAKKLKVTPSTISKILRGKLNLSPKLTFRIEKLLASQSSEQSEKEEVGA